MSSSSRRLCLDGYVRVSDVRGRSGPAFISPSLQRERIAGWCALYDAQVGEVYEELDESGGRADRPKLLAAIERVELGLSDGIVVAKLDRFGRSLTDALEHIERIQRAGGRFVSVQDQFDLGTDHGRLVLRMMLSFHEYERDQTRTRWNDARRKAVARGVHGGRFAPVGYRRRTDGRLRLDPRNAKHIRKAFAMRLEGAKLNEVGAYLRENRVKSGRSTMVWQPSSVDRVLKSRVYLGEVRSGEYVCVDAHPPLVDVVTWRLAQHMPAQRARDPRPGLLYGILRCASCRSYLTLWTGRSDGIDRMYRCSRIEKQRGVCPHRAWVTASTIDALAEDLIFAASRRRPQLARKTQATLRAAERDVETCEQRLVRYRDNDRLIETLDQEQYLAGLVARADAVRDATHDLQRCRSASVGDEAVALRGIERRWPEMDLLARRQALASVFDAIFLYPQRAPVEQRIWLCERGEGPKGLPVRGRPKPPRPFAFPSAERKVSRQARRIMAGRRHGWADQEIERRLKDFINGGDVFPTPIQFIRAGQRRLYDHVALRGGIAVWASRLHVAVDQRSRTKLALWTEDRVRNELAEFLADREIWPKQDEFAACGKKQLHIALRRFGGMELWAQRFGLPTSTFKGPHRTWTDERIEAALRELIGDSTPWPRRREFKAAGLDGCYGAIWKHAGVAAWIERMHVTLPAERAGAPRRR
jgi:DNA invertase Pin-like site-specific DNA recombinase